MTDKAKSLAEKLLELARRGVGGERENAEQLLIKHLSNYGLTLEEFEKDTQTVKLTIEWLKTDINNQNSFYRQVVASVIGGERTKDFESYINEKTRYQWLEFDVTIAEKIEIEQKIAVYWADYQQQLAVFYAAYIQKNHLYALPDPNQTEQDSEETPEERQKRLKLMRMMEGIDHKRIFKELN
ncbi:MAG: hypothetical protein BGO59_23300 [Spirosoma sp. 48-14]|mgnify:CR=1 FL=1|nr:MAG: hypothetical protein BGO59_23300 [Spirosoma sp. 48-14]